MTLTRGIALLVRSKNVEDADEILSVDDQDGEPILVWLGSKFQRFVNFDRLKITAGTGAAIARRHWNAAKR